jgi:cytosine/adenosine deaminase-related metal-dependent hydrolase
LSKSCIFFGGTVLTMDSRGRTIKNGAVYVEDGVISAVGESEQIRRNYKADVVIPSEDHVIMPGLVDCHVHTTHALIRGLCLYSNVEDCLTKVIWPAKSFMEGDDAVASAELSIIEMLKTGTTTFLEAGLHTRFRPDKIAESMQRLGIRGVLSKSVMDSPTEQTSAGPLNPAMVEDPERCLEEAITLKKIWSRRGSRIGIWLAPRAAGYVSPNLFRRISQVAHENGMGITLHLRESAKEIGYIKENYGMLPVMFAKKVGILGHRTLFAHMVEPEEEEIKMLASAGSAVAHCATSNAQLASGYCPVPKLLKAGVRIGLGCDGVSHNFTYDMFSEMRFASFIHKVNSLDPTSMPASTILDLATNGGARSIGLERLIGSIEVGKAADIITVSLNKPHSTPVPDPASSLVYSCTGADVDNVMVEGNLVVQNGKIMTCDPLKIVKRALASSEKVVERAGLNMRLIK